MAVKDLDILNNLLTMATLITRSQDYNLLTASDRVAYMKLLDKLIHTELDALLA